MADVKTYLSMQDLEYFRERLFAKRNEVLQICAEIEEEAQRKSAESDQTGDLSSLPTHSADLGSDAFEQEILLGRMESQRELLWQIEDALGRIDNNTYGICQGTGRTISRERLEAEPWARYSIEFQRQIET